MGRLIVNPLEASPSGQYFAITPSDSTNFSHTARGIYVGVGGTVVAVTEGGTAITFVGVVTGSILPIRATRINSTSTTATNMVGLY